MPNGAERILALHEAQSRHRQELEKIVVKGDVEAQSRGQYFGLLIGVAGLLVAAYFGYLGQPWLAIATVVFDVGGLAAVFVTGKLMTTQERQARWDAFLKRIGKK